MILLIILLKLIFVHSITKAQLHIEDIPFHVIIEYDNKFCSGSLISSRVVLTTASCFIKYSGSKIHVRIASQQAGGNGITIKVIAWKKHEYFQYMSRIDNDIAIAILDHHVYFSNATRKIEIAEYDFRLAANTYILVSGLITYENNFKYANSLIRVHMKIMDDADCIKAYGSLITFSNFCAAFYNAEKKISDNGGPAFFDNKQYGILSFNALNEKPPHVAVFTNVSYFSRWIYININCYLNQYCVKRERCENKEYIDSSDVSKQIMNENV